MKDSVEFGANKTPTQTKPSRTAKMEEGYEEFPVQAEDTSTDAFDLRSRYIRESIPLSTVPLPGSSRAVLNTALQALKGNSAAVLIDKLGQRLAYERSGVRLYDALLTKCKAAAPDLDTSVLESFRAQEAEHFAILHDVIKQLGADPTAQTPCADTAGMMAMGLVQVMTDPRTTIPQCAEALLAAELIDVAAWELLIGLADEAGMDKASASFLHAKVQEDDHLMTVREWLRRMTMENAVVPVREAGVTAPMA